MIVADTNVFEVFKKEECVRATEVPRRYRNRELSIE